MNKKHLIALADAIRDHNGAKVGFSEPLRSQFRPAPFTAEHITTLADFCAAQNPRFNRSRWMDYIRSASIPLPHPVKSADGNK